MQWLDDVERKIPSLIVEARSGTGADLVDVRVVIDGVRVGERLDGRAIDVDPGDHALRLEHGDHDVVEQRLVVAEGQKGRRVSVTFPAAIDRPPAARRQAEPRRAVPWPVYPLLGVSAIGLGGFAFFGIRGVSDRADLDACRGACPGDRVDDARRDLLFADISLGVALVSAAVAGILYFTAPKRGAAPDRAAEPSRD